MHWKQRLSFIWLSVGVASLIIWGGLLNAAELRGLEPLPAIHPSPPQPVRGEIFQLAQQRPRDQERWRQVYEQLPELPRENHYISKVTGIVDPDNTLISRLIRYHLYIKGRPANLRFDWKLTLADYLGANDLLEFSPYPSTDVLRENPMVGDRQAISRLNRSQREALVDVLVGLFTANAANSTPSAPIPNPRSESTPPLPRQPQPGDADLLKP